MKDSFTSSWMRRGRIRSRLLGAVIWVFYGLRMEGVATLKYSFFQAFPQRKPEALSDCPQSTYGLGRRRLAAKRESRVGKTVSGRNGRHEELLEIGHRNGRRNVISLSERAS